MNSPQPCLNPYKSKWRDGERQLLLDGKCFRKNYLRNDFTRWRSCSTVLSQLASIFNFERRKDKDTHWPIFWHRLARLGHKQKSTWVVDFFIPVLNFTTIEFRQGHACSHLTIALSIPSVSPLRVVIKSSVNCWIASNFLVFGLEARVQNLKAAWRSSWSFVWSVGEFVSFAYFQQLSLQYGRHGFTS